MTTQQYLANYGVSMGQAETFIMDNINNPDTIYNVAKDFGVNNDMIADIVQADFPDLTVTGQMVSSFFSSYGLDGNALGFNSGGNSTAATSGTLDMSNLHNYEDVLLFQNVSQELINNVPSALSALDQTGYVQGGDYAYASNDTWDSIKDLGYTNDYTTNSPTLQSFGINGIEDAHSSDNSSEAFGFDASNEAQVSSIEQMISLIGVSNPISDGNIAGPYDLIVAI